MSKNVQPVPGAAGYTNLVHNGKECVFMIPTDGESPCYIQGCKTYEAAIKAADKWQTKENKAVAKEAKRLAKEKL